MNAEIDEPVPEFTEGNPLIAVPEGIKLTKNSRGYNWDIRLNSLDIKKLEELNLEMLKRFNNGQ